ncbi:hypothetical protein D3C78_1533580 [compost metagenome]
MFRRIHGGEDAAAFVVVPPTFVRQGQLAGTAANQLSAQSGFQCLQHFADGRLAGLQLPGYSGKTAPFDHPHENRHCIEFVHEIAH